MQGEHKDGPPSADPKRGNKGGLEEVEVEGKVVGVEERLGRESLFKNSVGQRQQYDAGPAAPCSPGGFADEERSTAVERRKNDQSGQHRDWEVAEQKLSNKRSQKKQPK